MAHLKGAHQPRTAEPQRMRSSVAGDIEAIWQRLEAIERALAPQPQSETPAPAPAKKPWLARIKGLFVK